MKFPLRFERADIICVVVLLFISFFYLGGVIFNDDLILHGDLRYALDVSEQFAHHLNNLAIHAPKLPWLTLLYPLGVFLGDNLAEKAFISVILFLGSLFVYSANKQFISRALHGTTSNWLSISAFVGTLVFLFNPWTINKIHHHYWLVLSLASSYLLLSILDRLFTSRKVFNPRLIAALAISTWGVATQPQGVLIYFLPIAIIYGLVSLRTLSSGSVFSFNLRKVAITFPIVFACNLFWLVPALETIISGAPIADAPYGIVEENVDQLSRRASLHNVLRGSGHWVWGGDASPDMSIMFNQTDIWPMIALFPLAITILYFGTASKNIVKNNISISFAIILLLSIVLSTGSYYLGAYRELFLDLPFGEAIRDPYKFAGLYFIAACFFTSGFVARTITGRKSLNAIVTLVLCTLILSWGWVALTPNLNGHLSNSLQPFPSDLEGAIAYLSENGSRGSILWYPTRWDVSQLSYATIPALSTSSLKQTDLPKYTAEYVNHLFESRDKSVIPFLEHVGVQFVVLRHDLLDSVPPSHNLVEAISGAEQILSEKSVYTSNRFTIYELVPISPQLVDRFATGVPDITKISGHLPTEYVLDQHLAPYLNETIVIAKSQFDFPFGETTYLTPTSRHHSPDKYWSQGSINGGWLNNFESYLKARNIENWQYDYGVESIFTWRENHLKPYDLDQIEPVVSVDFSNDSDVSDWKVNAQQYQALEDDHDSLKAVLSGSVGGWKTISSPSIVIEGNGTYAISLRIKYTNAEAIHVKVIEFDDNDRTINSIRMGEIGSGTSDWKPLIFEYSPSKAEVKKITINIWHGEFTKNPLPNLIWLDDFKIYDLSENSAFNTIDMGFELNRSGNYTLLIRILESPEGGLLTNYIDNQTFTIKTLDQNSRFVWKEIHNIVLDKGKHIISIENTQGFNIVNLVQIVDSDHSQAIEDAVNEWLSDAQEIAYKFEAESDFRAEDLPPNEAGKADAQGILQLTRTISKDFEVVADGNYTIQLMGFGKFVATLAGESHELDSARGNQSMKFSSALDRGVHTLIISPVGMLTSGAQDNQASLPATVDRFADYLDYVTIILNNDNLPDDFHQSINLSQSDSEYGQNLMELQASIPDDGKPRLLSIPIPFNDGLVVKVYNNSALVETSRGTPLFFSLKTGFWITSYGSELDLVIVDDRLFMQYFGLVAALSFLCFAVVLLSTIQPTRHLLKQILPKVSPPTID